MEYSNDILDRAMHFAIEAHKGMYRKRAKSPYILHPMEAASIVGSITPDREVIAAAVLHDVVEDTDVTMEEIRELFGERVAILVASETEDKRPELPKGDTWQIRKEESLRVLRETNDINVKIVWMGDKLSNMRSFARTFTVEGEAMWNHFNQKDPAKQEWYYREVADALSELNDTFAYMEYNKLLNYIFTH